MKRIEKKKNIRCLFLTWQVPFKKKILIYSSVAYIWTKIVCI